MTTELTMTTPSKAQRDYAVYLLKTCWPGAPDDAVMKGALICARYNLDPLLKEVCLVKFDKNRWNPQTKQREKIGEEWVPILGIRATRKIATRNVAPARYSYLDGPRVMTDEEQKTILGEVSPDRIWAITKLKLGDGVYPGYGFWLKADNAYGQEKGNSQRNMAFIRSERNAIDRMIPGAMPEDVEVGEETAVVVDAAAMERGKAVLAEKAEQNTKDLFDD